MKGRKLDQSGAPNQTQIIVNKTKIRNWSLHSARTHQAWWKSGSFSTAHATVGPSKPNPFQITQDVFSHRPFQLTHYSPALCNQIKRKINYSMDHYGARREDAQYNTGRTAVCMHGMVWSGLGGGSFLRPSRWSGEFAFTSRASFFSICASQ